MPSIRYFLLALGLTITVVSLVGCGRKQTVKPGTEEQVKEKFPAPPKSGK